MLQLIYLYLILILKKRISFIFVLKVLNLMDNLYYYIKL